MRQMSEALLPPSDVRFCMEKERWIQVRDLLHELLEQDSSERKRLLDLVGATDPDLRREAESLLQFENEDALDHTALGAGGLTREFERAFPDRIGPYRLLNEVGRGGMGVVYEAERDDGQFSKRVALKLLPAVYSQTELETRFLRERQILARLEHPNIARLLDGGLTPDGRPYLVMEFVEGIALTQWAESKPPAERLRLFLTVCAAVSSAHRSLVVHRDIKPGNILVNQDGQAKLLDFGLARILESSGEVTQTMAQTGAPILTPAYASPEQVLNHPITVASDIFSLGVVLYELLTAKRPFGGPGDTASQVQRAVCGIRPRASIEHRPRASLRTSITSSSKRSRNNPHNAIHRSMPLPPTSSAISMVAPSKRATPASPTAPQNFCAAIASSLLW